MAFKRYAALLAGSAIVGSALLVPPAMAQEGGNETAAVKCYKTETTEVTTIEAEPVTRSPYSFRIQNYTVADDINITIKDTKANPLEFEVGDEVEAGTYKVTLHGRFGIIPLSEEIDVEVTKNTETVTEKEEIGCATISIADVSLVQGEEDIDVTVPDGASDLQINDVENLKFTVADDSKKVTINATDAEAKEYTVPFSYQAEGAEPEGSRLTGSFKVTVTEKDDEDDENGEGGNGGENGEGGNGGENGEGGNGEGGDTVITQTIDDVTVTEGEPKTVDLELKDGVTDLEFTETGDLEIKHEDSKLTVDAKDVKAGEYTVKFTYKVDGDDEAKEGTFKVTVKAETDEDKDEPKENASSKASSNFLGSFKGLSSK
ncbi:MAG: hypothetical protein GX859_12925 [Corynebacterium humireducens]|jgi:hypothetical protein|uniref:Uncharacterized protein n=1 Tax=Corynebacterium humireducens TaxID=1223514 RepID=A0A7X6SXH7_9CORY|nr:hypothetical protein [Corynebacterium humireducens]